ncbi:MAG: hypothetical protein Q9174_007246, partial [Haloplaca sp. 1 TL-2023]
GIITSTSRDFRYPLPLLSVAEQLYLTCISAGWSKDDDCVTVRLYLPSQHDLVAKQAGSASSNASSGITHETIKDLLVGVHLVAVAEAMSFCDHMGIDAMLMYDIVSNAAGASKMFVKAFEPLRKAKWSLKLAPDAVAIRDRLV